MEFVVFDGFAFCDTYCLVEWVLENAAQQSVHPTAAGVSESGENSESGGG